MQYRQTGQVSHTLLFLEAENEVGSWVDKFQVSRWAFDHTDHSQAEEEQENHGRQDLTTEDNDLCSQAEQHIDPCQKLAKDLFDNHHIHDHELQEAREYIHDIHEETEAYGTPELGDSHIDSLWEGGEDSHL